MKNIFFKLYIFLFFLLNDFILFAQPGQDNPGGDLEGEDPPTAPLDGKLIWLGIVAILFGFCSYKRRLSKV